MFRFIVLLAFVPAIFATTGWGTCEDRTLPLPDYINVAGCDAAPCPINRGDVARMTLGFKAPRDVDNFEPIIRAGVLGVFIDYDMPEDVARGCDHLEGARCPLSAGEDVIYNFSFYVQDNYPRIPVDVDLNLADANGRFLCVRMPIRVIT